MQVANALNNYIRILFNPKVEAFKLFDFLIVKSNDDRYLAQITEIYDDKFDSSQNVAKLKLFYKITPENEVMPYDNFTPNKECEIIKIKQDEIENFINQDRETFTFATNTKSSTPLNLQYEFFDNAVVLADKIENVNSISLNIAQKLSSKRNVILIDSTGIVDFEDAKKIKASKNFKMPLNYSTIDYVFERCLKDATLEFQAIGGEILNEIKKFAKRQESNFIPFSAFVRVLLEQYKATPFAELKLLLSRIKKFQMDEIFAKTKKDKEALFKTIEKSPITIIDLSSVDTYWQKAYLEYIISEIEQEVYFIVRVNDDNFDVELINKIYNEKKNIKFIPNVSYNYKKLPSIMQFCKNYILMPSLYQRSDFLDANFALCNLIQDGCIVFGESTNNFLYLAGNYEPQIQEKKKNYRKIALTLANEDNNSTSQTPDSQKLMEELTNFEEEQKVVKESNDNFEAIINDEILEENKPLEDSKETFEPIENPDERITNQAPKDDFDVFDEAIKTPKNEEIELKQEAQDEFQDLDEDIENNQEEENILPQEVQKEEDNKETEEKDDDEQSFDDLLKDELNDDTDDEPLDLLLDEINYEEKNQNDKIASIDITNADIINPDDEQNDNSELVFKDEIPNYNVKPEQENNAPEQNKDNVAKNKNNDENVDFSDEELDFFQIAQQSSQGYKNRNSNTENREDDIDLAAVADDSINTSFEQIVSEKTVKKESKNSPDIIKQVETPQNQKENLPIFKEKNQEESDSFKFAIGDIIVHKKYGRGKITKTIRYEERQLLQIEFDEAGKKLLDPTVADIKPE